MKTLFASATFVAGCLAVYLLAGGVNAQGPRTASTVDRGIRVIDIKRVFDEYSGFASQMNELKAQVKTAEAKQAETLKELRAMAEEAKELKPGSPARRTMEKKIFTAQTVHSTDVKIQQAEFVEKEFKIYHSTFRVIKGEVAYYCKVKNVAMVVQYNSAKADPNNRKAVMAEVFHPVVAQNGIDITDTILRVLNRESEKVSRRPSSRTGVPRNR